MSKSRSSKSNSNQDNAQAPQEQTQSLPQNADALTENPGDEVLERLGSIRENLQNIKQTSDSASQSLQEWEDSLDLRDDSLQKREASLREHRTSIDANRAELCSLRDSLQQASDDLDARIAEFQQRDAQAIAAATQLQKDLDAAQQQMHQRDEDITSLQEKLASLETSQRDAQESLKKLDALHKEHESLQENHSLLAKTNDELEATTKSLNTQIQSLQQSKEDAAKSSNQLAQLQNQFNDTEAVSKKLVAANESLHTEIDEQNNNIQILEASCQDATQAAKQLDTAKADLNTLRHERDSLSQDLQKQQQLAQSLQDSLDAATQDNTSTDKLESEIARRDKVIEKLSARADTAQAQLEISRESVAKSTASVSDGKTELRLHRLRKMKILMQAEGKKIGRARRAVAQKHLNAERVLQQQGQLAKQKTAFQKREQAVAKLAKRNSMARVACMLAIAIGILGFGAWEVAKMVPATFLVNATLQAKGPLAEDPDELAAWRNHMTSMITDTRLIDTAAERMGRRGLEDYASAPKLSALINDEMELTFPAPDTMSISLVGVGDLNTERLLETYLAVFVSLTNDAAVSYGGSISASITQSPKAEAKPLDEERLLMIAGGIWSSVTFLVLGVSVWASGKFATATAKLRKDNTDAAERAFSYDGISQLPPAA